MGQVHKRLYWNGWLIWGQFSYNLPYAPLLRGGIIYNGKYNASFFLSNTAFKEEEIQIQTHCTLLFIYIYNLHNFFTIFFLVY